MTLHNQVIKGVAWLSLFKLISQAFSWATTIIVARLLTAKAYGLMEMATVFTGYIEFFVEFGISAAIINKKDIKESELSSLFWFLLGWGIILGSSCLLLAPLTAWYFEIPELKPITSTVGLLFVISSLVILPRSLLHRDFRFKEVGAIDAISVLAACFTMLVLAKSGAGVWTLLGGTIAREAVRLIILYSRVSLRPTSHFSLEEVKPILKFGAPLVASSSLFYIYNKADRFFGGKLLGEIQLGYYAIALQLASMPVEKILSIFQSAVFPAFSKLKDDPKEFNKLFLQFASCIYTIILPLFMGGFLLAENLVFIVLGEKWQSAIGPFKFLLIAQIFVSIGSPLSIIHTGRGRPAWTFYANLFLTPLMLIGFYFSARLGDPGLLALPWVTIYPLFVISYLILTLRQIKVGTLQYLGAVKYPIMGTIIMSITITFLQNIFTFDKYSLLDLGFLVAAGGLTYLAFMYVFAKTIIFQFKNLK